MPQPVRHTLDLPSGFASREAALFVAQLDDQSRRLLEHTRGLTAAALGWQPAPGQNTMGILLAHVAYYEVFWDRLVLEDRPLPVEVRDVLGLDREEVGTPLPPGGAPPAALAGREIAFFHDLLGRARAHTHTLARRLGDADLGREITIGWPDGSQYVYTPRWALYHMLEHEAAHQGQLLLLRHQFREGGAPS